ncbi:MAG: NAD(P)-dependent oxidoreductase [Patescibacteria group bacterium]
MHAFDADFDGEGASSNPPWNEFRGARIFLTGGTGFYGCCLLHTFTQACDRMTLDASIHVLTRDPERFAAKAPALATHPAVMLIRGDVRSFAFPAGHFSHVLHAATDVVPAPEQQPPELLRETIVEGTRRVLAFGNQSGVKKLLLVSSGFVYGPQPPSVTHMPEDEDAVTRPLPAPSTYVDGKREAERLWRTSEGDSCRTIARCYSSVGPYLPLDAHFAVGNFIRDAARGGPICVSGDGTPHRSYLYTPDLSVWLWTILCHGQEGRAYNVGSEHDLSIADLARTVAATFSPSIRIEIAKKQIPGPHERFVPSTLRARSELGLKETVPLREAIRKTAAWYAGRAGFPHHRT